MAQVLHVRDGKLPVGGGCGDADAGDFVVAAYTRVSLVSLGRWTSRGGEVLAGKKTSNWFNKFAKHCFVSLLLAVRPCVTALLKRRAVVESHHPRPHAQGSRPQTPTPPPSHQRRRARSMSPPSVTETGGSKCDGARNHVPFRPATPGRSLPLSSPSHPRL